MENGLTLSFIRNKLNRSTSTLSSQSQVNCDEGVCVFMDLAEEPDINLVFVLSDRNSHTLTMSED